ncbi:MAG: phosphohydrolase [Nitrospinae bacterium RIFCSPLOWO2_12_39_15]|nr:MAG: phosphohydrolase [Nitrospinae bacterium RIFCSPHIGHO2_02_39_11]OGV99496.1 MAG: phosphohydrolase [Nitrospinae bacterium RIFCSPHIGHO2_12_FULL_39_42]OGW11128.1 MAG: phosphohydrolase [Nitrospinae bacterium RIFCSPLOWO2_12_39_15]
MGTVIENTRLFEKYDDKVKKLKILKEVSQVLNSTLDEKEVRRRAMEAATRLMNAEVGSLLLIDQKTRELFFEVALGERGEQVKEIRLAMGEGIAGWVAEIGQPLIVNDVQKDPRFSRKADDKSAFKTRNMICVPVKIRDKVSGVLQAINKLNGQPFTQWDLEEFGSLAAQVAIAIENANLYKELKEAFLGTAEALGDAIEAKDAYTAGHTRRVLSYSLLMGRHLDITPAELENLKLAAALHDIGKIGVEDQILQKQGKLNEAEKKKMDNHTVIGPKIVENIKQMRPVIPGICYHHEEYDGTGYPQQLKGEQIPLIARIIAVADCFDAMTTDRPYRKALSIQTALDELQKMAGTQFDGKVVEAFIRAYQSGDLIYYSSQ